MSSDDEGGGSGGRSNTRAMSVKFESEEFYASRHSGWVPFTMRSTGAMILDATQDPSAADELPRTSALCAPCSEIIATNPLGYKVEVERHYKPMLLSNNVKEGWLEKLGGDIISNWKKRWMMVTEKGLHYFETPPSQGEKKKKAKGSKTFLQGSELAVSLIENPDPAVHKDCKDTSYYYFGLAFRAPAHTFLMRVSKYSDKESWIQFFNDIFKRLQLRPEERGKDPPAWKATVDRVLQQLSEEKEYLIDVDLKKERYQAELKETREKIAKLRAERDAKRQDLLERQKLVALKLSDVRDVQQRIAEIKKESEEAEAQILSSRAEVESMRTRMAQDIEHAKAMEDRAVSSLTKTQKALHDVKCEIEELRETRDYHFAMWRKAEEHFHEKKASTTMFAFSNPEAQEYSAPASPTVRLQLPSRVMPHEVSVKHVPSVHWKSSRSSRTSGSEHSTN
jgi:hypothetical protein